MKRCCIRLFLSAGIFILAGCATNRGYLNVEVPKAELVKDNGKQIFVRSIEDKRIFEVKPKTPDIPSLGFNKD